MKDEPTRAADPSPADSASGGVHGQWVALGMIFGSMGGTIFGLLTDNLALGMIVGAGVGLCLGATVSQLGVRGD